MAKYAPPEVLVEIEGTMYPAKITRTRETMRVDSYMPVLDPNWTFTDSEGHWHYAAGREYPSLKWISEPYWCRDCHESHDDGYWVCATCGEEIKPGTKIPEPEWVVTTDETEVEVNALFPFPTLTRYGLSAVVLGQKGKLIATMMDGGIRTTWFVFIPDEEETSG